MLMATMLTAMILAAHIQLSFAAETAVEPAVETSVKAATEQVPAAASSQPQKAGEPRIINWLELMPEDERKALEAMVEITHDGDAPSYSFTSERTVPEMDGVVGRIGGYIVPLATDADGALTEFFIVPYFGACLHVPPPPPNQLIYVKPVAPLPMGEYWDAYWLSGTFRVAKTANDMATAMYQLDLHRLEVMEYDDFGAEGAENADDF